MARDIADFYCAELRLIIELDGGIHDLRQAEDAARDQRLRNAGFQVLRFTNAAFAANPCIVLSAIRERADNLRRPPHPSGFA